MLGLPLMAPMAVGVKFINFIVTATVIILLYAQIYTAKEKHISRTGRSSQWSATIVLGRLRNETERINWLQDLKDVDRKEIYIVDDPNSELPHLEKNHGREAAVYLTYIINNYYNLSDITFFWHNQQVVWHNNLMMNWDSVETINRMDRDNIMKSGYVPSRCDQWPGCPSWIRFNPSKAENRLDPHRLEEMFNQDLFSKIFPEVPTEDIPPYFAGTCCSQFAVARHTIQSRPIETYRRLLDWVLDYQFDDRSGMVLEYTWPYLFTGSGTMCPTMRSCYCKTYNHCMNEREDVKLLEKWNSLRTRREEVKWQVTFMEDAVKAKKSVLSSAGVEGTEKINKLAAFQPEYVRLSAELERLAQTTWETREKIIQRWGLGVPPVGW